MVKETSATYSPITMLSKTLSIKVKKEEQERDKIMQEIRGMRAVCSTVVETIMIKIVLLPIRVAQSGKGGRHD